MASLYYEIRVAGVLPPEALLDFERLSASIKHVETVLHGPLPDQAALHGLLARLETLGVQVLEIRRLQASSPPDRAETAAKARTRRRQPIGHRAARDEQPEPLAAGPAAKGDDPADGEE